MRPSSSFLRAVRNYRSLIIPSHAYTSTFHRPVFLQSSYSTTPPTQTSQPIMSTTTPSQQQTQSQHEQQQPLSLPSPSSASDTTTLAVDGQAVKLDHLGPMVVNVDGTLSRISNWETMAEVERQNTLRIIGKRNKARLEKLKEQGEGKGSN